MKTLVAVKNYSGSGTPEALGTDIGVQKLAMMVLFATLQDKYGVAHEFHYSTMSFMREGRWKGLPSVDDVRWADFKVCREEIEEFLHSPVFDWWVALMGGEPEFWHRLFKTYNDDGDARELLENAASKLRWEDR